MERVCFTDKDRIGVYDGEVTYYESEYIVRYREYDESRGQNDEWKYGGEGARFRGDTRLYRKREADCSINGVCPDGEGVFYSFSVGDSSGIAFKELTPNAREAHLYSSSKEMFGSVQRGGRLFAVTVLRDGVTSDIGTLDPATSELRTLTEGDSRDSNPFFDPHRPSLIYFDSAGVGRNARGEFTGEYEPSAILSLELDGMRIEEVLRSAKHSYFKPKIAENGDLYCIKRPNKAQTGGNVLLDILLFPFRILKAIFGFLQAFVMIFGNTSLTSATAGGDNPARGRTADRRQLFVEGRLLDAEREERRNRKKGELSGFIPKSWKLIRLSNGKEEVLRGGICDFSFAREGGIYCTDGRHVLFLKDGKVTKLADAGMCLCVSAEQPPAPISEDLFA